MVFDVERRELSDVAVGPGHFVEAPIGRRAARAFFEFDLAAGHFHAALAERNDQLPGGRVVAHGLPVVAAFGAGARLHPLAGLLLQDFAAIVGSPVFASMLSKTF